MRQLFLKDVPMVSYDTDSTGRTVISVDEIDDIDSLAVTSKDTVTGEIHTDYLAGVVCCTRDPASIAEDFVVPGATSAFTPRHPAFVMVRDSRESELVAEYAQQLRDDPRGGLTRHRHLCGGQ